MSRPLPGACKRKLQRIFYSASPGRDQQLAHYSLELIHRDYAIDDFFGNELPIFSEALEAGLKIASKALKGYVYLAVNPVHPQGVHKVGKTRLPPTRRMESLTTEGVLGTYQLVKAWPSRDVHRSETRCHRALANRAIQKEFFEGDFRTLVGVIDAVMRQERAAIRNATRIATTANIAAANR